MIIFHYSSLHLFVAYIELLGEMIDEIVLVFQVVQQLSKDLLVIQVSFWN